MDQGPRGTCAACAVSGAHQLAVGQLLSVEDAFFLGKQRDPWPTEDITSVTHILAGTDAVGHATEASWPYGSPAWPQPPPAISQDPANRHTTPTHYTRGVLSFREVTALLPSASVVLILAHVPSAWEIAGGLVHDAVGGPVVGAHAVVVVGFAVYQKLETLIIRNSWGASWGEQGYGYLTKAYFDAHLRKTHVIMDRI